MCHFRKWPTTMPSQMLWLEDGQHVGFELTTDHCNGHTYGCVHMESHPQG